MRQKGCVIRREFKGKVNGFVVTQTVDGDVPKLAAKLSRNKVLRRIRIISRKPMCISTIPENNGDSRVQAG